MSAPAIAWHRLTADQRAAVLDVAEAVAARAVADALADVDDDLERAFWAGVDFARRYDDHAADLAAWAVSTPDYATLLDRRGEHDRAAAVRAEHARRGLTAPRGVAA